jgi:hypothetical protein
MLAIGLDSKSKNSISLGKPIRTKLSKQSILLYVSPRFFRDCGKFAKIRENSLPKLHPTKQSSCNEEEEEEAACWHPPPPWFFKHSKDAVSTSTGNRNFHELWQMTQLGWYPLEVR